MRTENTSAVLLVLFLAVGLLVQAAANRACGTGYRWDAERWTCAEAGR